MELVTQHTHTDMTNHGHAPIEELVARAHRVGITNIAVTEQEIADEYAKMAEQYKMDVEKIKTIVAESALSGDLRISNALEFIKTNAKVKKASKKKAEETEETAE